MEIPSGILCKAIAKDSCIPSDVSVVVDAYVVIPSGMLWIIKTKAEIIPKRCSVVVFILFSLMLSGIICLKLSNKLLMK